ncbi:MAG: TIGR03985 family CRISPR-associated protein [Scytonema sp. PMC 1069.18]|nr:TIGR03985 family CRISPR-associated protein [Scytonema sp. PMC 1069.18]MEC4884249.1 TIGR03985 family CRISPR-associated protein [Scytonema sp. PMC 1070.18]
MSELIFGNSPNIELLQWLAQGSLLQNLLRSIRLWVWLRSLYGEESCRIDLPQKWNYANWRDAFFSKTHPKGEKAPLLHDQNCACAKTTADWIFAPGTGIEEIEWRESLTSYLFAKCSKDLTRKSELLIQDGKEKKNLDEILKRRLFAVTRRSLQEDLYILKDMGLVKLQGDRYQLVDNFYNHSIFASLERERGFDIQELPFLNLPDLEATAQSFFQPIGGYQRFFLDLDYIVYHAQDNVDNWQEYLKQLWTQTPIPPVRLTYNSAKLGYSTECIVYPVCIYYTRRAIYLCAFGETPNKQGEWYNYRLDRIQVIKTLDWSDFSIPKLLLNSYPYKLPTPEYVREQMAQAWGFDFYEPSRLLLLRFEQDFHERYIQGTFRHTTFEKVTYQQAKRLIKQESFPEQQALLKVIENRSHQDAYYKAFYRDKDVNVVHRLRSWRPNAEVLLPWDFRRKLAQEAMDEVKYYQD